MQTLSIGIEDIQWRVQFEIVFRLVSKTIIISSQPYLNEIIKPMHCLLIANGVIITFVNGAPIPTGFRWSERAERGGRRLA